jgi:hypothetical protein
MTNIKTILAVIALVTVFVLGGVVGWIIKPGVKTNQPAATVPKVVVKKIVENPAPKQIAKADAVITKQTTVKASGTIKIKPKPIATLKESKYTIPLTGTATTTYIDTETGSTVGQGSHAVTGQANITVQDDTVTADVTIEDTNQVAVTIERVTRKNEIGCYSGIAVSSDPYVCIGGYYQRNLVTLQTKKTKMALFARVSAERRWGADRDWEGRLTAGVRVEF